MFFYVYYESIKREPKIRGIYECRCDERLQTKTKKFTRLPYTCFAEESFSKKTKMLFFSFLFLEKGQPGLANMEPIKKAQNLRHTMFRRWAPSDSGGFNGSTSGGSARIGGVLHPTTPEV
jgi:hypothetical protein